MKHVAGSMPAALSKFAAGATLLLAGTLVIGFAPSPANAGLTISCAPTYAQSAVTVGDSLMMSTLTIINTSDGTEGMAPVSISNIRHTPACGNSGAGVDAVQSCDVAVQDPGVFTVSMTATGIAPPGPNGAPVTATACVGRTFTIAEIDAATGEVLLTPDIPIVLQQSGQNGSGCVIQFTSIQVNKVPTHDANPAPGDMTNQLCRVTVTQEDLTVTNGGLGQVTVLTPTPSPTSTPTNTPTSTPTTSATNTPTNTPTITPTSTFTHTPTSTPTNTPPPTDTSTPTFTAPPIPVVSSPTSPAGLLLILGLGLGIAWMIRKSAAVEVR